MVGVCRVTFPVFWIVNCGEILDRIAHSSIFLCCNPFSNSFVSCFSGVFGCFPQFAVFCHPGICGASQCSCDLAQNLLVPTDQDVDRFQSGALNCTGGSVEWPVGWTSGHSALDCISSLGMDPTGNWTQHPKILGLQE